jgi:hypothetical protein
MAKQSMPARDWHWNLIEVLFWERMHRHPTDRTVFRWWCKFG